MCLTCASAYLHDPAKQCFRFSFFCSESFVFPSHFLSLRIRPCWVLWLPVQLHLHMWGRAASRVGPCVGPAEPGLGCHSAGGRGTLCLGMLRARVAL